MSTAALPLGHALYAALALNGGMEEAFNGASKNKTYLTVDEPQWDGLGIHFDGLVSVDDELVNVSLISKVQFTQPEEGFQYNYDPRSGCHSDKSKFEVVNTLRFKVDTSGDIRGAINRLVNMQVAGCLGRTGLPINTTSILLATDKASEAVYHAVVSATTLQKTYYKDQRRSVTNENYLQVSERDKPEPITAGDAADEDAAAG